jgi:GNAT superfamily N-acetyltransferase
MTHAASSLRIRKGERADIPALVDLLRQLFSIEADFQVEPDKQAMGLELLLRHPGAVIWVAENGGVVVGMITVQVLLSTAEGAPVGLVEDLVVAERWRRRGAGRQLLRAAEAWAAEQGLTRLQLLADSGNSTALAFYRNHGWFFTQLQALRKRLR